MLIEKSLKDNMYSVYVCDRCNTKIDNLHRYGIYVAPLGRKTKKKWDLCDKCYKSLIRGIGR